MEVFVGFTKKVRKMATHTDTTRLKATCSIHSAITSHFVTSRSFFDYNQMKHAWQQRFYNEERITFLFFERPQK